MIQTLWPPRKLNVIFFVLVKFLSLSHRFLEDDVVVHSHFFGLIGQVYFALTQAREDRGIKDVAISRIEQLSPFPYDLVRTLSSTFGLLRIGN